MENDLAVAIVGDFKYLRRHLNNFINKIRQVGNYSGEIIILTSYLVPTIFFESVRKDKKIKILRFKKARFNKNTNKLLNKIHIEGAPNRNKTKKFQWHKINLFDERLKKWKYIFYLDINMNIHYDINPILELRPKNELLARSDSYPEYERKLESQFYKDGYIYQKLEKKFDLNKTNYFQTGLMYFDTNIIKLNTKKDLVSLIEEYPISYTNEQGIMNLYFDSINKQYRELPAQIEGFITYFYWIVKNKKIIITKQIREKYK